MTYADFVADVIEELGTDGTRRGIEALRARSIRNAVLDLQRYIRGYREARTTIYQVADLTEKGYAHLGTLPTQAKPKAFYVVSEVPDPVTAVLPNPNVRRNRLDSVAWEDRQSMIDGRYARCSYKYAISPFSKDFMVHPLINDETYLLIVWDGLKRDYADGDTVPWPEQAAEAVGAYVKAKIARIIDKRTDLAQMEYGAYVQKRLSLWREWNEAQVADGKDEEYDATSFPNPTPLQDFGAQSVPFLSTVTQVSALDNTGLSFIPTTGIVPNFAVEWLNTATLLVETWVLKAGTDASDGVSVQRPNDYSALTNARVWYKQS